MDYKLKYLKYKEKYINLKKFGGSRKKNEYIIQSNKSYKDIYIFIIQTIKTIECILFFKFSNNIINIPYGSNNSNYSSLEEILYNEIYKKSKISLILNIELLKELTKNNSFIDDMQENGTYNRIYICKINSDIDIETIYEDNKKIMNDFKNKLIIDFNEKIHTEKKLIEKSEYYKRLFQKNNFDKLIELFNTDILFGIEPLLENIKTLNNYSKCFETNSIIYIPCENIKKLGLTYKIPLNKYDIIDINQQIHKITGNIIKIYTKIIKNINISSIYQLKFNEHKTLNKIKTIIFSLDNKEDNEIWWNKNKKHKNLGNNTVACRRNRINIILQSDEYFKKIALNINIKLFKIIKLLQDELITHTCNIENDYISKQINKVMKVGYPGAFKFENEYLTNLENLNNLNFRELMHLFFTTIFCGLLKNVIPENTILVDLIIKLQNIFQIKKINLYENSTKYDELNIFLNKFKKLNELINYKFNISGSMPICWNMNICNNNFFNKMYDIPKEEKTELTVTFKQMTDLNMPLTIREKKLLSKDTSTDNSNEIIGWKTGTSSTYVVSGKIVELANLYNYDISTGISGNMWRFLLIICCLDLDINESFRASIIFLNGCFHHSTFECILAGLQLNKFLEENNEGDKFCTLNIDHSFLNYEKVVNDIICPLLKSESNKKKIKEILEKDLCHQD